MKLFSGQRFDPGLHAEMLVPDNALEKGINQADDDSCCDQLRIKAGAFGNAAGNDGRDGCGKGEQKEELDQLVAIGK